MSQDLLRISPEALQLQLPSIAFGTLKNLYVRLYQHMRNNGNKMTDADVLDVQRKLTKLQREILFRGGKQFLGQFQAWEKQLMHNLKRG
jgi:hypothetical protein